MEVSRVRWQMDVCLQPLWVVAMLPRAASLNEQRLSCQQQRSRIRRVPSKMLRWFVLWLSPRTGACIFNQCQSDEVCLPQRNPLTNTKRETSSTRDLRYRSFHTWKFGLLVCTVGHGANTYCSVWTRLKWYMVHLNENKSFENTLSE